MNTMTLLNDFFNNNYSMNSFPGITSRQEFSTPDVDIQESDNNYLIEMDLPGRTEKDISLELNDKLLTISSVQKTETQEVQTEKTENKPQYLIKERRRTQFRRTFSLPKDIDDNNVKAEFKNGVLSVYIPRKADVAPKKISIISA
ncbi:MAG: Hsp20/alpha crystallin family protein [Treponema sp.]|nr:Hsp20/alpha crystallin family protein [Treponema sp.]